MEDPYIRLNATSIQAQDQRDPFVSAQILIWRQESYPTSVQIFGYGESPVASLGECTIAIHTGVVFTIEQSSRT